MRIFLVLFFALIAFVSYGQIGTVCADSNRVNPWYQCGPNFAPVCACDGNTYRNECLSYNAAGLNYVEYSGVCRKDFFFYDFWPNIVTEKIDFYMQFAPQQTSGASIQIFNSFGNVVYLKLLNNVGSDFPYQESIALGDLKTGVYFILVQANGVYKQSKFIKHSYF
jgi:hypothetical protein